MYPINKTLSVSLALALVGAAFGANQDHHVVLISLDGFPAEMWHQTDLPVPNLRRLAAEVAAAEAMTVTNPSSTWSSHTSMITGLSPRRHGVLFNGQVVLKGPNRAPVIEQWATPARSQIDCVARRDVDESRVLYLRAPSAKSADVPHPDDRF